MFSGLTTKDTAVINVDDVYAETWRATSGAGRVVTFGVAQPADFTAKNIAASNEQQGFRSEFDLVTPLGTARVVLHLAGLHNLRNALGAAAAAYAAGASLEQITEGFAAMRPVGGRLELKPAINGAYLIDDSYNANPSSLKAGLDALQMRGGRRWLILGDMMELGVDSDALHAEVGRYAQACGIERLLAVGTHTRHSVDAFGPGAQWFSTLDALIESAKTAIEPHITVLIKGSRSNRLERAAQALSLNPSSSSTH
jgi:UDP-N-acetylmuramoyl-tripeptide--D-alanyl-D-alanine ligase